MPVTANVSLIVIDTPCSGPREAPRARAASASLADLRAPSSSSATTAFIRGLSCRTRARFCPTLAGADPTCREHLGEISSRGVSDLFHRGVPSDASFSARPAAGHGGMRCTSSRRTPMQSRTDCSIAKSSASRGYEYSTIRWMLSPSTF